MSVSFKTIITEMAQWAPLAYAEEWDNVGLQVGDENQAINCVLLALTPSEDVIQKACRDNYDAVLTHHPLLFKGVKNITTNSIEGRKIISLIKNGISLASFHTNLDIAAGGVNDCLAKTLGLENIQHFVPMGMEKYYKIVVYVPLEFKNLVQEALSQAGCGCVGSYSDCSFVSQGQSSFKPLEGTSPFIGKVGELTYTDEVRLETIVPENRLNQAILAMTIAHPYEEPAYDIFELAKRGNKRSIGRIGYLSQEMTLKEALALIAEKLSLSQVNYSGDLEQSVQKIALCGGSGCGYLANAQKMGADLYLTGDVKFHDYQKAEELGIALVDGGHFATEKFILEEMRAFLVQRFPTLEIDIAEEKDFKQVYQV